MVPMYMLRNAGNKPTSHIYSVANIYTLMLTISFLYIRPFPYLFQNDTFISLIVDVYLGLEFTSYQVDEKFEAVEVCVTLQNINTDCAIGFPFNISLSTVDGSAGITQYGSIGMVWWSSIKCVQKLMNL